MWPKAQQGSEAKLRSVERIVKLEQELGSERYSILTGYKLLRIKDIDSEGQEHAAPARAQRTFIKL